MNWPADTLGKLWFSLFLVKDPPSCVLFHEPPPPVPCTLQGKRHVTKHLFSDTDTDRTRTGTDVSWLRESSRKPKPKVTDYTRKAPAKTVVQAPDTTCRQSPECTVSLYAHYIHADVHVYMYMFM